MKSSNGYLSVFFVMIILITLSCATGYNKHADQYFEEGLLFFERMEYDRSIESFDKVLELAPYGEENNIVYYNRGMAYLKNRQYERAIYDFTKALELTSGDKNLKFDVSVSRGDAYRENNAYDDAIKDYSDAIKLNAKHKDIKHVYSSRAWIWSKKGNHAEAIDDYNRAIKIDPEFDAAYYGRATVWLEKKDFQRALEDVKEAVKLRPASKKYDDLLYKIRSSFSSLN